MSSSSSSPSNVTSDVSLSTRFKVWFFDIPLVTRGILVLCSCIFLFELLFGAISFRICLIPSLFMTEPYRIYTSPWFHSNILHILLNMLAFQPMGINLERSMGSLKYFWLINVFIFLNGLIHILFAGFAFYNPFYSYAKFWNQQCSVGFSGVIFSLLVIRTSQSRNATTSVFSFFTVPTMLYPWVLLIILQLIMPNISFLGHLAGIISGNLYIFGFLNYVILSDSIINSIETSNFYGWIISRSGYITNPELGSPSSSLYSGWTNLFPSPSQSSSSSSMPFSGTGYTLGSSNTQNERELESISVEEPKQDETDNK